MAKNDENSSVPLSGGAFPAMEALSRMTSAWWHAQTARLLDEAAPWNLGVYVMRRMGELSGRPLALTEEPRSYKVEADLPGMKPQNLDIRVADGMLRISGEADSGEVEGAITRLMPRERFEQQIPLPTNADVDKATAELHDGRIIVTMPKYTRPREHKVAVKSA